MSTVYMTSSLEFLEDLMQLSKFGVRIKGVTCHPDTGELRWVLSGDDLPAEDGGRVHMRFVRDLAEPGTRAELLGCL